MVNRHPALPRSARALFRLRLGLLAVALVLGATILLVSAQRGPVALGTALEVLVGWSFAGSGLLLWNRRPANRLGVLMTAVGIVWLLGRTLTVPLHPATYTIGVWMSDVWTAGFVLFLLSFPTGRLVSAADRAIVGVFLFVTVPLEGLWLLFWQPENRLNVLAVAENAEAARLVDTVQRVTLAVGAVLLVAALGRRWLRSSGPVRRQMVPVLAGAVAILIGTSATLLVIVGIVIEPLQYMSLAANIAIPVAVLVVMVRTRLARAAVADLVVELGRTPTPARLRDALAHALGDASLQVAWWSPLHDRFEDADGGAIDLPAEGSGQALTVLEREGVREAAIIHDEILLEEPGLIASVASAMRLAVENERLTVAVEEQLVEVRASRARIVAAGDAERQRVERDLHDGAQQRLVAVSLALRLARTRLGDDANESVRTSLEQASEEARAALAELRELARGIHPQILTEAGLRAAIESLAARAPCDVSVEIARDARFPPPVEAVGYFVASEALANVAKYAHASLVRIRADWRDGVLSVVIEDDGIGGADLKAGGGLRGLSDRLSAVDGTLDVVSPRGGGTRLVARIPSPPPVAADDAVRVPAPALP